MIRKILHATAVIIGDAVESWATQTTREDLLTMIDEQQERIRYLEEELDQTTEAAADLRLLLMDTEQKLYDTEHARDAAKGKDPDPYDPYDGGIWPEKYPDHAYCEQCGDQCGGPSLTFTTKVWRCDSCNEPAHVGPCTPGLTTRPGLPERDAAPGGDGDWLAEKAQVPPRYSARSGEYCGYCREPLMAGTSKCQSSTCKDCPACGRDLEFCDCPF